MPDTTITDGLIDGLPEEMRPYLVLRPAGKIGGGWTVEAGTGLDPEVPAVQEFAAKLLSQGNATRAMMGGTAAKPNDDRKAKKSLGGDGRWFNSPQDVRKAAAAWAKAQAAEVPADADEAAADEDGDEG
jgi:hypothetical protein